MPGDVLRDLEIRTIVLVREADFGRCPLAADLSPALWPVAEKPALRHLLDHLAGEGVRRVTVCCPEQSADTVTTVCEGSSVQTTVVPEVLANGTAGCMRDATAVDPGGDLLLVLSAGMTAVPPLDDLIRAHWDRKPELTMVFNPSEADTEECGTPAEIYLCRPEVLRHIPAGGYFDIKEGLIPAILRAGGTVEPYVLDRPAGNFRDRHGYLEALDVALQNGPRRNPECGTAMVCPSAGPEAGQDASVHPTARIHGPVAMAESARLLEGAVVVGPAAIGPNVTLGENSAVVRSALWAGATVEAGCEVRDSIVGENARVLQGRTVAAETVTANGGPSRSARVSQVAESVGASGATSMPSGWGLQRGLPSYLAIGAAVLAALLWSYWSTIVQLTRVWLGSDEYSSGLLVPFLAVYAIWCRRKDFESLSVRPAIVGGVALLLLALAARMAGALLLYGSLDRISLVVAVAGCVLLLLGYRYTWRLAPFLVFLLLMLPWPNRVQAAVAQPLQRWATSSAVFCLEMAGYEVVREGNVIHLGDASVAVAEACNGLRMVTAFFVISGLVVLLVSRPWWEKLIVLVSSLPIALLCNTVRLSITAVFFTILEGEHWEQLFHDWGGYAMMPLALAMVVGEFWLLRQLTTPPTETMPAIITRREAQRVPDA